MIGGVMVLHNAMSLLPDGGRLIFLQIILIAR